MPQRSPERQAELEAKLGPQPHCANPGCIKPVNYNGGNRWGHFCTHCIRVSQGKFKPLRHVTYLRKFKCSNYNGKLLGFNCYTDWKLVKKDGARIITHMDHIDGDHTNNNPKNLQELCDHCHTRKSQLNGDKDGWKNKRS